MNYEHQEVKLKEGCQFKFIVNPEKNYTKYSLLIISNEKSSDQVFQLIGCSDDNFEAPKKKMLYIEVNRIKNTPNYFKSIHEFVIELALKLSYSGYKCIDHTDNVASFELIDMNEITSPDSVEALCMEFADKFQCAVRIHLVDHVRGLWNVEADSDTLINFFPPN